MILFQAHQHFFEGLRCDSRGLLLLLFLLRDIGTCGGFLLFVLESLDATHSIHKAHFAREERMAFAADFHLDFILGCSHGKGIAARARHNG